MANAEFDKYRIHKGQYWDVYVSDRGYHNLGRIYFWLRGDRSVKFHELTNSEYIEMMYLLRLYWRVLQQRFKADHYNFSYLANETKSHGGHCHVHLVPRYYTRRRYGKAKFHDPNPQAPWQSLRMPEKLALSIGKAIRREAAKLGLEEAP